MSEKVRVLVADDHPVVRKGLIAMLDTEEGIQVVGEARSGKEAVALAVSLKPQVVLMDLVMPEMDGIEATRRIKQKAPEVNILVLTSFSTNDKVLPSLNAGAIGYLLKDSDPSELVLAIYRVARGEGSLDPAVTPQILKQHRTPLKDEKPVEQLTDREVDVLRLMARGYSNQEIARLLVLSPATVFTHVNRILTKLNVSSRTQAVLYALRRGLVTLDEK